MVLKATSTAPRVNAAAACRDAAVTATVTATDPPPVDAAAATIPPPAEAAEAVIGPLPQPADAVTDAPAEVPLGAVGSASNPQVLEQAEDSILLERTAFDEDPNGGDPNGGDAAADALSCVHLAVILALCLDVKNNNPRHGLTTEQMRPYVERVLLRHNNWTVYSTGLLQR
jgi:hypothetical protein